MVDANARSPLQALSKRAFNSDHRLAVVAAMLSLKEDLFDKQTVVDTSGVPATSVYRELMELHHLGLLTRARDGNRVWFAVVDGPFWLWSESLLQTLSAPAPVRDIL